MHCNFRCKSALIKCLADEIRVVPAGSDYNMGNFSQTLGSKLGVTGCRVLFINQHDVIVIDNSHGLEPLSTVHEPTERDLGAIRIQLGRNVRDTNRPYVQRTFGAMSATSCQGGYQRPRGIIVHDKREGT